MNVVAPRAGLGLVLSLHSRLRCIRFASALQHVDAKIQIYKSSSRDPFLNLSIEHHLFKHAAPGTTLLLFYTNRPCIVIGRNQNPWLEVNHRMLKSGAVKGLESIDLVRRRSGGGAVFHDEGNANWSVMCDLPDFTRDKHAEMVVRGLRRIGVDRARVNERHDVVLDVGQKESSVDPEDTHATPYTVVNDPRGQLKVTGSAYKMAKGRALHHGTALLSSPHVAAISKLLNSPAKGHLDAKGIGSVSSPVTNLGLTESQFHDAVLAEFRAMYNGGAEGGLVEKEVGEECLQNSSVREGYEELKSSDWIFGQTPKFSFTVPPANKAPSNSYGRLTIGLKRAIITDARFTGSPHSLDQDWTQAIERGLRQMPLCRVDDWESVLFTPKVFQSNDFTSNAAATLARELNYLLPGQG